MPRGRPANYDRQIADLTARLKDLIVRRERVEMEVRVAKQLGALIGTLGGPDTKSVAVSTRKATAKPAQSKQGKPSPGRLRQIAAMKAYWKKKKAEGTKTAKAGPKG